MELQAWLKRRAARVSLLAFVLMALGGVGPADCLPAAHASLEVSSFPGLTMIGSADPRTDHTPYKLEVSERFVKSDPPSIMFGALSGSYPALKAAQPLVQQLAQAAPSAGAVYWSYAVFLGVLLTPSRLSDQSDPKYRIVFHERNGRPIALGDACEMVQPSGGAPPDPSRVECPVYPDPQGGAGMLQVSTAGGADVIYMNLSTPMFRRQIAYGYSGDDYIVGSQLADELAGNEGNDTIKGQGGDDWIHGLICHSAAEFAIGLPVDDSCGGLPLEGTLPADNDSLYGGDGADIVLGGYGNDLVSGGDGDDMRVTTMRGGPGTQLPDQNTMALAGGQGDDVVIGGAGRDYMEGNGGRDTILAKESDFGELDTLDQVADCGPNLINVPTKPEYFRRSTGDPIRTCNAELALSDLALSVQQLWTRLATSGGLSRWWWYGS